MCVSWWANQCLLLLTFLIRTKEYCPSFIHHDCRMNLTLHRQCLIQRNAEPSTRVELRVRTCVSSRRCLASIKTKAAVLEDVGQAATVPGRPSLEKRDAKDMFGDATNIATVDVNDAEKLYLSLPERGNDKHTLIVLYTPSCQHCKGMEAQVRRLASGLSSEASQLSIMTLDCSTPAARYFVKQVLDVPAVPSFCIFPRHSRTFYKYRGTSREAESLLKFLNLVCNQNEERLWVLSQPEAAATAAGHQTLSIAADSNSGLKTSPVNGALAVGLAVGLALLAGAAAIARSRQSSGEASSETFAAADTSKVAKAAEETAQQQPMQKLLSDIDSTLGRMTSLTLRLLRARLGLIIAPMDDESIAIAAGSSADPASSNGVDVDAGTSSSSSPPPATPGGGRPSRAPIVAAATITLPDASDTMTPVWLMSEAESSQEDTHWSEERDEQAPEMGLLPKQALELAMKMQATVGANSYLGADQVLALMEEESDDVGRVIERLMKLQQQKGS